MTNSERFLHAFAQIERYLRENSTTDRRINFYERVDTVGRSRPAVRRFERDLKDYADLRNAIIHESSDGHVIAEPNERAAFDLERIAALIVKPPVVIPLFQTSVVTVTVDDTIAHLVRLMLEHALSQIPVLLDGEFAALLTTGAVARWLGARTLRETSGAVVHLDDTYVADVLNFIEDADNHKFTSRHTTLFEAIACFEDYETRGRRLDALLITANGFASERIIGVMTIADLPRALKEVGRARA